MSKIANAGNVIADGNEGGPTLTGEDGRQKAPAHAILERLEDLKSTTQENLKLIQADQVSLRKDLEAGLSDIKKVESHVRRIDDRQPYGQKLYSPMAFGPGTQYGPPRMTEEFNKGMESFARFALDLLDFRVHQRQKPRFGSDWIERAQSIGATDEGGYLVSPEQLASVEALQEIYGLARRRCRRLQMANNKIRIPVRLTLPEVYFPDEGDEPASESGPTFGRPELEAKRFMAYDVLTIESTEDTIPLIQSLIGDWFAISHSRTEDEQAFSAELGQPAHSGAPNSIYNGLLYATGPTDVPLAAGTTYASVTYDDLLTLIAGCSPFARAGAGFIFSSSLLLQLRKLKDDTLRPLWQEMAAGNPNTIFGYPYDVSEVMPEITDTPQTGLPFMLFGNYQFHGMGLRRDFQIDFSAHAQFTKGNIVMRTMQRVGFEPIIGSAIARLVTN